MAKQDIYEQVTNRIIEQLKRGVVPWMKPWSDTGRADSIRFSNAIKPMNGFKKTYYTGFLNTLLLWMTAEDKGYSSNKWYTFNQVKQLGGSVKAGEKSTVVFFYKSYSVKVENKDTGEEEDEGRRVAKEFWVFNHEQTTLKPDTQENVAPVVKEENTLDEEIEAWIKATGAVIRHGGNRACYSPLADYIQMPFPAQFKQGKTEKSCHYYATLFHEMIHWTGNEKRNKRTFSAKRGDRTYALEELIAELGSAFLCAYHGVEGEMQHASYIDNWLSALENDKKFIFAAAANAKVACDFLHSASGIAAHEEEELAQAA
jgi:antirestriction protein ArdC